MTPEPGEFYPTGWFPTSDKCEENPNDTGQCLHHNEYHDTISNDHLHHLTQGETP